MFQMASVDNPCRSGYAPKEVIQTAVNRRRTIKRRRRRWKDEHVHEVNDRSEALC